MRLTVVNLTKSIASSEFHAAVAAIRRQVNEDFAPVWNISAVVRATTQKIVKQVRIEGKHDAILYLGDSVQDPTTGVDNALGYHSDTHGNIPYGFVYLDICQKFGEEWTVTLSHEVLELLADPSATLTINGPDPRQHNRSVQFDLEVCDPTQGDTYPVDDVRVSNFVTPAYFGKGAGTLATNFLELKLDPFGVRPAGYFQYEDALGAHQIEGERAKAFAAQRASARQLLRSGRRNTRRAERHQAA